MHFIYFDAQAELHTATLSHVKSSILDLDMHWLSLGHKIFPQRLHAMDCFEKIISSVPEDHQFTFKSWYDMRTRSTHCIWYAFPKKLVDYFADQSVKAQCLIFVLSRYFPPSCRNKSVICFVDVPDCECVVGYVQGHCVCFKKLPARAPLNIQHEWQYLQQTYPQWMFEHSLYLTAQHAKENTLVQTHQTTIHVCASENKLNNRIALYGLD